MTTIRRTTIVRNLSDLRSAWQDVCPDLAESVAPPGMLLLDVCLFLNLTENETSQILGNELYGKVISQVNGSTEMLTA